MTNKFDPTDPIVKKAIDFVCEAIALNPLFLEVLLMDPADDKDDIFQCTAELMEKHDSMYVIKFIHAVTDSNLKVSFEYWKRSNKFSNEQAKAQFHQMVSWLRDIKLGAAAEEASAEEAPTEEAPVEAAAKEAPTKEAPPEEAPTVEFDETYNKNNIIDVAIVEFLNAKITEALAISRESLPTKDEIVTELIPILDRQKVVDLYDALVSISSNEMELITGKYSRLLLMRHKAYQGILNRGSVSSAEIPSLNTLATELNEVIFDLIARTKQ